MNRITESPLFPAMSLKKDDDLSSTKLDELIKKCNSCTIEKFNKTKITNQTDELLGILKGVQITEDNFPQISKGLKKVTSQSNLFKDTFSKKLHYFYRHTKLQSPELWYELIVSVKDKTSKLDELIEKCNSCTTEKLNKEQITNQADELFGILKEIQITEDNFPQISKELKKVTSRSNLFKDTFSKKLHYFYRHTELQSPELWYELIVAIRNDIPLAIEESVLPTSDSLEI